MEAVGFSGRQATAWHLAASRHSVTLCCVSARNGQSCGPNKLRSWLVGGMSARCQWQQKITQAASAPQHEAASNSLLSYNHLLLALLDANPYLGAGSKQALATTAGLAVQNKSKITVLMVDASEPEGDPAVRLETIQWHLREGGVTDSATFLEKALDKEATHNPSVALGDVADEVEADMLLLSSEAVHSKAVDANLLAEFVSCPVLLLP